MTVAVLFAMPGSVYFSLPGCDVYDEARNALAFPGGVPVVAHPPCRTWGQLAQFATKAPPGEHDLAFFAVDAVRECGGVLEHPAASKLWPAASLPEPGGVDMFGGFTVELSQFVFGHRAEKLTRLYVCGCSPHDVPPIPARVGDPLAVVSTRRRGGAAGGAKAHISKRERLATPPAFAAWLVELARRCDRQRAAA